MIGKEEICLALFKDRNRDNFFVNTSFDLVDANKKRSIDFRDFVLALNVIHPNSPHEDKVDFCIQAL